MSLLPHFTQIDKFKDKWKGSPQSLMLSLGPLCITGKACGCCEPGVRGCGVQIKVSFLQPFHPSVMTCSNPFKFL